MNIGDYIRTDIGEIRKVVKSTDDVFILDKDIVYAHKDKIKKSSPNIIDLIEKGDYVNGEKVESIEIDSYKDFNINNNGWKNIADIKSIVTKEQFESMKYEVEE